MGVTRMDRMKSNDIRERLRQEDVLDTVLRKKKQWLKKIREMSEERLAESVYGGNARKETKRKTMEKMGR